MKSIRIHIFGCLFLLSCWNVSAQDGRPLLADIDLQKIFIDANREKLLGHYQDAAYLFREVLNKDPKNHSAAYELSRMYDVLEQDALALKAIEKAVKLVPGNVWYMDFYGKVLERNNKHGRAADVYASLAKSHSDNEYFLFQQAYYLTKADEPAKAVVIYDKIEKMIGVNEELTRKKYVLYYKMGDKKASESELKKLISEFPEDTDYKHILAEFYKKENRDKDLQKTYEEILRMEPNDAEANLALAESHKENKDHFKYLKAIEPIVAKPDVDIDVKVRELFPYITIVRETKDNELKMAALDLGHQLTEAHAEEAKAHSLYADMLYHSGKPKEALKSYEKTLEYDKSVFPVWEQIMYIHAESQQMDKLISVSDKALDLFPNHAKVYYMNGFAHSYLGKHGEAANMFEQALMMSGKNVPLKYEICNRLGVSYYNLKKYERSDKMFEKALELSPEGFSALHNYSYHLSKRDQDLDRAKEMSIKANELNPGQPAFQTNLGSILFKLKEYKNAKKWVERALTSGGDKLAMTKELYGDILFQEGNKDAALENWKSAKDLGGDSKSLERKIIDKKM